MITIVKHTILFILLNFTIQLNVFASIDKERNRHYKENTQTTNYIQIQKGFPNKTQIDKTFSKNLRQSSLAFVFDATGSMGNDLEQLTKGAQMILDTMLNREYPPIKNYVLVPYRDPVVGPVTVTTNSTEFQDKLNKIEVYGGGDCPEMSVTAITLALNVSLPYSYIYVFTDASATDHFLVEDVLTLIQRKKSQVFFILTGDCEDRNSPNFQVYEKISAASSGQIFNLEKEDVIQVLKFINNTLDSNNVNLFSKTLPKGYDNKYKIPVDDSLKDITVSVSGETPKITITDPKGSKVNGPPRVVEMLDLSKIKIVTIVNPEPGNWTITAGSKEKHTVKIIGKSELNFDFGFSQKKTKKFSETTKRPLIDSENNLLIKLTNQFDNVKTLHSVDMLNLTGNLLFEIPLKRVNESDDEHLYETDAYVPPKELFQIAINGIDKDGNNIRRVGSSAVENQFPEIPILEVQNETFISPNGNLKLKCKVESAIPVKIWWSKNDTLIQKKQKFPQSSEINFTMSNVNQSSEGIYTCKAINDVGSSEAHTKVLSIDGSFIKPSKIEAYPEVIEYQEGESITFNCSLSGFEYGEWTKKDIHNRTSKMTVVEQKSENDIFLSMTILNSTKNDETIYECKGFLNPDDYDFVEVKTRFIEIPLIQNALDNNFLFELSQPAILDCNASGIPKPSILWLSPNNITILDKMSNNETFVNEKYQLTINNVGLDDEGIYTCKAENSYGYAKKEYNITVWQKLAFSEESSNVTINIFDSLNMSCDVIGYPLPKIIWYHNGKQIESSSKNLILKNVTLPDMGKYSCEAKNNYEEISKVFFVAVTGEPPIIKIKPNNNIFQPGKILQIICMIESVMPVFNSSLYFLPKPSLINNEVKLYLNSSFSNINQLKILQYSITTSPETEGSYICESSNNGGTSKEVIHVNVLPPLIVKVLPLIVQYENHENINFICNIYGSKFGKWLNSDSSELLLDSNIKITSESTENDDGITLNLIIENSSKIHSGTYKCLGFRGDLNEKEFVQEEVAAEYVEKPEIAHIDEYFNLEVGRSFEIICNASGSPEPSVFWITPNKTKINNVSMSILNVSSTHEGIYSCHAQNEIGNSERVITLNVWSKPKFLEHFSDKSVDIHENIDLICNTFGVPKPEISWYHNDNLLEIFNDSQLKIIDAKIEDEGNYTCKAKNEYGEVAESLNILITGLVAPKIEKTGSKIVAKEGENLVVHCRVLVGDPKPDIYWMKKKMNDSEIFMDTLEIENATEEHEGIYICVAKNSLGDDKHELEIIINRPPKFIIHSEENINIETITENQVNFSCDVTGNPKPFVTWTRDDFPIRFTNITYVNENNSLVISKPQESDAGVYTCIASNFLGHLQKNFNLFVFAKPIISNSEKLTILEFIEGKLIVLPCHVYGVPFPDIKWSFNNAEIIPSEYKQIDFENSLRFIANLTESGYYQCEAINRFGKTNRTYLVVIFVPPSIYPENNEVMRIVPNSKIILKCNALGFPEPQIKWSKNNEILLENSTAIIFDNYGNLQITNTSHDTSGNYICTAENNAGISQKIFQIILNEPPIFVLTNVSSNVIKLLKGDNEYSIPCQASGNPSPQIRWFKDNEIIINNHHNRIGTDNTLVLKYIVEDMSGMYTCQATNSEGNIKLNYTLEVIAPPTVEFEDDKNVLVANEGSKIVLKCPLKSMAVLPQIIWFKGSEIIEDNLNKTDLIFDNVKRKDAANYSCFANNTAGETLGIINLHVQWPPRLTYYDNVDNQFRLLEGDSFALICDVDANPPADIQWMKDNEDIGETSPKLIKKSAKYHHSGEYICSASNLLGQVEKKFSVQVSGPPKIEGPEFNNIIRRVNRPTTMECFANGIPKPKIKWNIIHAPDWFKAGNGNVLKSHNISLNSMGIHSCEATNDVGYALKQFNITVLEPPRINTIQFFNSDTSEIINGTVLKEHSHIRIECNFTGSYPVTIMWIKNGKVYKTPNLVFDELIYSDSGKYTCEVRNNVGSDEMDFIVDVFTAPRIANENDEFNTRDETDTIIIPILEEQSLKLNCRSDGNPIPDIYWFKDKNYMGFYDANMVTEEHGQVLHIKNVLKNHHGNYTCEARNSVGVVKKHFFLDVLAPPSVMQQLDASFLLSAKSGQDVVLECPTVANPKPTTKWLKHPYFELQDDHTHLEFKDNNNTLVIHNVSTLDSGNYSCITTNLVGMSEISYSLEVLTLPKFLPLDKKKLNTNNEGVISTKIRRSFQLYCAVEGFPEPTILWYKDGYPIDNTRHSDKLHISFNGQYFNMMDATVNDGGIYTCKAENILGNIDKEFKVKILVPAEWGLWSDWSSCSSACGVGYEERTRKCHSFSNMELIDKYYNFETNSSFDIGSEERIKLKGEKNFEPLANILLDKTSCVGNATERRACHIVPCKVHGGWSEWTDWTKCSVLCGPGTKKRYRNCNNPTPKYGGDSCTGLNTQEIMCQGNQCSEWSAWSSWSDCTVSCGKGAKTRSRECPIPSSCLGNAMEVIPCTGIRCPVDGEWSQWSKWSSCLSCNKGYRRRTRICNNPQPQYGGKMCSGSNLQMEDCIKVANCYFDKINNNFDSSDEEVERFHLVRPISKIVKNESSESNDQCKRGFQFDSNKQKCVDINECVLPNNECHSTQICENSPGSYRCFCLKGFISKNVGQRCLDINECSQNIHDCSHACLNIPGSFICQCPDNYSLSKDQKTCIISELPVDSQSEESNLLSNFEVDNAQMHKSINYGSKLQYYDLGHAQSKRNMINNKESNRKFDLSKQLRIIKCPSGFFMISDQCIDIDECASAKYPCNKINDVCLNIIGSYKCIPAPCPDDYDRNHRTCTKKCENPRIPCLQKLVYSTFSSNKKFVQVPGNIMDLEYGGKANNSEYFIESQPFEKVFSVKTHKTTGTLYINIMPKLGQIHKVVIGCRTISNNSTFTYYTRLIIYIYIF